MLSNGGGGVLFRPSNATAAGAVFPFSTFRRFYRFGSLQS